LRKALFGCLGDDEATSLGEYSYGVASTSSGGGGDEVEGSSENQFFVVFFLGFCFLHTRKEVSSVFKIVLQNGITNLIIVFSWFH
jgi:hypothetical protein